MVLRRQCGADEKRFGLTLILCVLASLVIISAGSNNETRRDNVAANAAVEMYSSGLVNEAIDVAGVASVIAPVQQEDPFESFLHREYSPQASPWITDSDRAWKDRPADPHKRWVCAHETRFAACELVAVCSARELDGHGEGGLLDLYVLRRNGRGKLEILASKKGLESGGGSYGYPGSISVIQMGNERFGFMEKAGSEYGGYAERRIRLISVGPKGITVAATWKSSESSGTALMCRTGTAIEDGTTELDSVFQFDKSNPKIAVWPLRILEYGQRCCGPVWRTHRIPFDDHAQIYRMARLELENDEPCPKPSMEWSAR